MLSVVRCQAWEVQGQALVLILALSIGTIAGGSLALWGIGGAILLYALAVGAERRLLCPSLDVLAWGGSFLVLVAASVLLQPLDAARSLPMALRLMSFVLPLMLIFAVPVRPTLPTWSIRFLPSVLTLALGILAIDILAQGHLLLAILQAKHGQLTYYNRGLSYAAVLIWPLVTVLLQRQQGWLAFSLSVSLFLVAWLSSSRGAPLALVIGAGFYICAIRWPRLAKLAGWGLLALVAFGLLALIPWLVDGHAEWLRNLPPSWHHRFEIWHYTLSYYSAQPWLGAGVDATGILTVPPRGYVYAVAPAAHPHHMFLQLLFELGPLGWLWGVGLTGWAWHKIWQWPTLSARAAAMASWAALLTLACGAFSLWTDSFWAAGALAWLFCQKAKKI